VSADGTVDLWIGLEQVQRAKALARQRWPSSIYRFRDAVLWDSDIVATSADLVGAVVSDRLAPIVETYAEHGADLITLAEDGDDVLPKAPSGLPLGGHIDQAMVDSLLARPNQEIFERLWVIVDTQMLNACEAATSKRAVKMSIERRRKELCVA
jgi:hypothetical protein